LEGKFLAAQPEIDAAALALHKQAPRLAKDYLTDYSAQSGATVVERWRELGKFLLYKYLDGNVKTELGEVTHPGYPESWYRRVAEATGDHLQVRQVEAEKAAEEKEEQEALQMAEAVLTLLDARGIAVDDDARTKIREHEDAKELSEWLVRAATAESVEEVLERD
jgi:hypothetical protein